MRVLALSTLLVACAPDALELQPSAVPGGAEVHASEPVARVEITDGAGRSLAARTLPAPSELARLDVPLPPESTVFVEAWTPSGAHARVPLSVPPPGPAELEVVAPGGVALPVEADAVVAVALLGSGAPALRVRAAAATELRIEIAGRVRVAAVGPEPVDVPLPAAEGRHAISVRGPAGARSFEVVVSRVSLEALRSAVRVEDVVLPADARGLPDRARPRDRISLPSRWWRSTLRGVGAGTRPRDDQVPWCWQAVTVSNTGDAPVDLVLRAEVLDGDGVAAHAFRPRLRESDGGTGYVTALLRVPAGGEATASLPVFVDDRAVRGAGRFTSRIGVAALGSPEGLHAVERPLYVTRGSGWASSGFAIALLASLAGYGLLWARWRRWVVELRTSDLARIALFGSLTFVVGAGFQILGMAFGAVLGPFAPLVTGLPDDAFRACLLGTLLVLLPRPGVLALATVVGFAMRALALGSMHPVDLLYLGSAVAWLEGMGWLTGLTRPTGWRDAPWLARWLRLSLGLGLANAGAVATGLVVSVVLYRLFFAAWYVALLIALPGVLYVAVGCWLAVGFAEAVRRVQP